MVSAADTAAIVNALSATAISLSNVVTLAEQLVAVARGHATISEVDLARAEQHLRETREHLPKLMGYVTAISSGVRVH